MPKNTQRKLSAKQVMIDKSNSRMILIAGVAAFVTVFSLVAAKSLVSQLQYRNKVIDTKKTTLTTLKSNLTARDTLVKSYNAFIDRDINIIGGSKDGGGVNNGDNSVIVTDALPYKYDFPALATSLEKMTFLGGMRLTSVSGIDDEVQQKANLTSATPEAVAMPFEFTVKGSYDQTKALVESFQRSIRPFVVNKLTLAADDDGITMSIAAQTYYQPSKELQIKEEVVK